MFVKCMKELVIQRREHTQSGSANIYIIIAIDFSLHHSGFSASVF